MTPEERQTVIDALKRAAMTCFTEYAHRQFMSDPKHFMNEAIAIMRREPPKTIEEAWQAATAAELERAARIAEKHFHTTTAKAIRQG